VNNQPVRKDDDGNYEEALENCEQATDNDIELGQEDGTSYSNDEDDDDVETNPHVLNIGIQIRSNSSYVIVPKMCGTLYFWHFGRYQLMPL
jgi:hypothetical protein